MICVAITKPDANHIELARKELPLVGSMNSVVIMILAFGKIAVLCHTHLTELLFSWPCCILRVLRRDEKALRLPKGSYIHDFE